MVRFFFFFKQKTAYEIGTGDWSSDVCSSDLGDFVFVNKMAYGYSYASCPSLRLPQFGIDIDAKEIGRASCRERV